MCICTCTCCICMCWRPVIDTGFGFIPQSLSTVYIETGRQGCSFEPGAWQLICLVWLDNLCQGSLPRAEMTNGLPWPHGNYVGAEDPNLGEGKHFTFWAISLAPWMGKFKGQNGYNIHQDCQSQWGTQPGHSVGVLVVHAALTDAPIMVHTYSHTYVDCMF